MVTAKTFGRTKIFICINTEKQSINMKKILYSVFMLATIIAKTKCAFFQNEMCIFCVFFAVSQLVLNGLLNGF